MHTGAPPGSFGQQHDLIFAHPPYIEGAAQSLPQAHQQQGMAHNPYNCHPREGAPTDGMAPLREVAVPQVMAFEAQFPHLENYDLALGLGSDKPNDVWSARAGYLKQFRNHFHMGMYVGVNATRDMLDRLESDIAQMQTVVDEEQNWLDSAKMGLEADLRHAQSRAAAAQAKLDLLDEPMTTHQRKQKFVKVTRDFSRTVKNLHTNRGLETVTYEFLEIVAVIKGWRKTKTPEEAKVLPPDPEDLMILFRKPLEEFELEEATDLLRFMSDYGCGHN